MNTNQFFFSLAIYILTSYLTPFPNLVTNMADVELFATFAVLEILA